LWKFGEKPSREVCPTDLLDLSIKIQVYEKIGLGKQAIKHMGNELVDYLRNADNILIFSGAGISTNSGIPDFRGPQGVWQNTKPVYYQDFMSSEESRREYWEYKLG